MVEQNKFAGWGKITRLLSPAVVLFSSLLLPLPAPSQAELLVSVKFPSNQSGGAPARTSGGGTRGPSCAEKNTGSLIALMPTSANEGITIAANPTLFWYIPKTTTKKTGEFVVIDNQGKRIYQTAFDLPQQAGVIKLNLPETAPLEVGKNYRWRFAIVCDPIDRSSDMSVRGTLRRSELPVALKTKLQTAAPLEQARLYAEAKIWQETLSTVAQLRRSKPLEWQELLRSVGLSTIAQAPFIE